jgi:hypothetical protein
MFIYYIVIELVNFCIRKVKPAVPREGEKGNKVIELKKNVKF